MQHEIIMSLAGISGDVIRDRGNKFEVDEEASFLSQSEKEVLVKIVDVGYHYKYLNDFVSLCNSSNGESNQRHLPEYGVYLRGFAFSLQELLVDYGNNLREIEKQYMQDNSLSLLYLYQKTQKYRILLPYLHELVDRLKNKKGGEIIEIVYSCSTNGDPIISKEINKFLNSLLKILYTQIGSWIVYGYIDDNYHEYFIQYEEGNDTSNNNNRSNNTTSSKNEIIENENDWSYNYNLNISMLPQSIIPINLGFIILYIGKAMKVLLNKNKYELPNEDIMKIKELLFNLQDKNKYDTLALELAVDKILHIINKHLYNLLVINSELINHLNSIRNYMLLGNGELFQMFIELSRPLMMQPIRTTSEQDLNYGPWSHASRVFDLETKDKCFKNYELKIETLSFIIRDPINHMINNNDLCYAGIIDQSDESKIILGVNPQGIYKYGIGAVWYNSKIIITNGFETIFKFKLSPEMGGISFIIQNNHIPIIGKEDGGLGYESIRNSIVIEYDYYSDPLSHTDYNINKPHISIHTSGKNEKCHVNHKYATTCVVTDRLQYNTEITSKIVYVKLDSGLWNIRIYLEDMEFPLINEILNISNYVQLDSDNSCYIGLISSCIRNLKNSNGTEVIAWKYESYKNKNRKNEAKDVLNNNERLYDWERLYLNYKIEYPLHLLITPDILSNYKMIFQYLFKMKRISYELQSCYSILKEYGSNKKSKEEEEEEDNINNNNNRFIPKRTEYGANENIKELWSIRYKLAVIIDNIYYYLQVDVIESQFSQLIKKINECKDYKTIDNNHKIFIENIIKESFITQPSIKQDIMDLIQLSLDFSILIHTTEELSKIPKYKIDYVESECRKIVFQLYSKMNKLASPLLTRLDLNDYFQRRFR